MMNSLALPLLLAQGSPPSNAAIYTFAVYILGVMVLAWLSNRLLQTKSFVSEYFLGSRSLGVWAFALTFAATSSSGGSFIGFPSLVYTHGWVVALWIGSYMIVPIVSMGLLAKRINQVARRTGAITIPDVLRDRFESRAFGTLSIVLIVFFMAFNLIAQFKGGSVILQTLLEDVPLFEEAKGVVAEIVRHLPLLSSAADDPGYLICLIVFTLAVVVYTAYGGFRAVVWTDVMQGFVMVGGVVLMLPLAIFAVNGLGAATQEMAAMTPPQFVDLRLEASEAVPEDTSIPISTWIVWQDEGSRRVFRTSKRAEIAKDEKVAKVRVDDATQQDAAIVPAIEITYEKHARDSVADVITAGSKTIDINTSVLVRGELEISAAQKPSEPLAIPQGTIVDVGESTSPRLFRVTTACEIPAGATKAVLPHPWWKFWVDPSTKIGAVELAAAERDGATATSKIAAATSVALLSERNHRKYKSGADRPGVYVTGPGPSASADAGFLPLSLAISFFFMWTFSGAGQPSNMVRLMAFKEAKTLRQAIFTVSIYYSLIYFPLVIIFCCARVLLPGWESASDRIMPEMAKLLTLEIHMPWLAGLLVAAPFAAVMSTMDSFLLMISSALVRDIYQRSINPQASEKTIKRLTYVATMAIGLAAMLAAVNPPDFLQDIIVFTGSGLSTSFLAPVALLLYWPRFNKQGALAGMLGGFCTHIALYSAGYVMTGKMTAYQPLNFHPFLVGAAVSFIISILVTLVTPAPPEHLVRKFFYRQK